MDSVYQSSHKVGVYIEKSKIKEWLEMCARIEKTYNRRTAQFGNAISKRTRVHRA